jgi:5-formyltetrahydrofolate cyclo-ligase
MAVDEKKRLRKIVKEIKNNFPELEKRKQSEIIFNKLEQLAVFKKAAVVLLYWSMSDEVFTYDFINKWCKQKTILLPSVDKDILKLKKYTGIQSMKKGELFGILEPDGDEFTDINKIDLIIVPGVAFDKNNNRMGRGRGYYDKLLSQTKAVKVGVCFNFQLFDIVPTEKHDLPMDVVISSL